MGYKIKATVRVPLPEDIADDLWVEIRHPKLLGWDVMKQLVALSPQSGESIDMETAAELTTSVITDWNLPPLDESGGILSIPSKDPTSWQKVPQTVVITAVLKAIGKVVREDIVDPNL